jgi:hypothetical protein
MEKQEMKKKQETRVEQVAAVCGAMVIAAVMGTGAWLAQQHSRGAALRAAHDATVRAAQDAALREAQRAESLRIRRVMLEAARNAEAAWIATTTPEERARQKEAALREFQAAEAEMLQQQTLARKAREARAASAASSVPQTETGR